MDDAQRHLTVRERMFPFIWALLYPLRLYLREFPVQRGKGIVLRHLVMPLLPPKEAEFDLPVPGAAKVALRYRETLGLSSLLYGPFEAGELAFASQFLRPGDVVMDIGANVGLFSVVMASAVGSQGRVFAFEPVPANVARLEGNLRRNGISNTQVFAMGLGDADGDLMLHMATDSAYPSLHEVQDGLGDGTALPVRVRALDGVWEELGRPQVAFIKMDVEGAEMDVLRGAPRLLAACRTTLLVEANSAQHLAALRSHLSGLGYRYLRPEGFLAHNHLFVCPGPRDGHQPDA
jgi:FkbM family methyltransferase